MVNDIKQLEQGVDLQLPDGRVMHRRGTVVQIAGDNLGINQLFGFVESFSVVHFCRLTRAMFVAFRHKISSSSCQTLLKGTWILG